jgi:predicted PurR-regulated permease PerM
VKDSQRETASHGSVDTPAERHSFARRVAIAVCIAVGIIGVALFLWYSVDVLLLAFAAILVAAMLRGMATWVAGKTRLPVGGALAVVIVSLVGFFIVLGVMLAPAVAQQFERLADSLPASVKSAEDRLRQQSWGRKLLGESDPPAAPVADQNSPASTQATTTTVVGKALHAATQPAQIAGAANYAKKIAQGVFTFVLVIIVGIYLAAQPRFYVEGALKLFPKKERPRLREVMHSIGRTLQYWLLGQLVPMAAIGTFIGAGL